MSSNITGFPTVLVINATSDVQKIPLGAQTHYLRVRVSGSVQIYIDPKESAVGSDNYITLSSETWEGPARLSYLYIKGSGKVEIVAFV